jgi:hypothetical protein
LPSPANCGASARSARVPTLEPRIVLQEPTVSRMSSSKVPGGNPIHHTTDTLENINAIFDNMRNGRTNGRVVITFAG